jgi:hypothetical protein
VTSSDHNTVNADEDESDKSDVESQDEGDMGHGARPGGGFTSVVSIYPHTDKKLKYTLDKLEGYCTAQPARSPKETVSS